MSELTRNSARKKVQLSVRGASDDESLSGEDDEISILMPVYDTAAGFININQKTPSSSSSKPSKHKKKLKAKKKGKQPSNKAGGGIGYTSGFGKTWDVNAYLKNQKAKNDQVIKLIEVM